MATLRVGCAMWALPEWRGPFLPADLRRTEQLAAYGSWCTAVEGNTTAYGIPSAATVEGWAADAPADLRFLFKLPQTVTHRGGLGDATDEVALLVRRLAPLGERVEQLAVQLPASFGPRDLGALAAVLGRIPSPLTAAVEVRHEAFFDDGPAARALTRLLTDRGAEWTTFDTTTLFAAAAPTSEAERGAWAHKPRLPRTVVALGSRPVVRYLGRDDVAATVAGWQPWIPVVAGWLAEGRTPTFFVHTPDNVEALALARRFHDEVTAVATVPVDPLPEPMAAPPRTLF